jgi:hypothetical protein
MTNDDVLPMVVVDEALPGGLHGSGGHHLQHVSLLTRPQGLGGKLVFLPYVTYLLLKLVIGAIEMKGINRCKLTIISEAIC